MVLMHFSLYLCKYEISDKKPFFMALLELDFIFVMYGRYLSSIYCCNYFVNNFLQWFFIYFLDCMGDLFIDVVENELMICLWMCWKLTS